LTLILFVNPGVIKKGNILASDPDPRMLNIVKEVRVASLPYYLP